MTDECPILLVRMRGDDVLGTGPESSPTCELRRALFPLHRTPIPTSRVTTQLAHVSNPPSLCDAGGRQPSLVVNELFHGFSYADAPVSSSVQLTFFEGVVPGHEEALWRNDGARAAFRERVFDVP